MLIQVIADYGHGDLAFAEVRQRLALFVPEAEVFLTPVPAFDTVSAGFCAAQLARTEGPPDRLVYTNVAPRADRPDPRPGNEGEKLVAAVLRGGVVVVGVNSEYSFSFLRDDADVREVAVPEGGSQFRSRDLFPSVVADLARGDRSPLGVEIPPELIPAPPVQAVAYVDGYGNIKTTWTEAPAATGQRVEVSVGEASAFAVVTDGTFAVHQGDMSFAPGSSGWSTARGHQQFYEMLLRGGSAADQLGRPRAGEPVHVKPV
jgi:hypothetical protein